MTPVAAFVTNVDMDLGAEAMMKSIRDAAGDAVEANGGEVLKFIGLSDEWRTVVGVVGSVMRHAIGEVTKRGLA